MYIVLGAPPAESAGRIEVSDESNVRPMTCRYLLMNKCYYYTRLIDCLPSSVLDIFNACDLSAAKEITIFDVMHRWQREREQSRVMCLVTSGIKFALSLSMQERLTGKSGSR